MIYNPNMRYVCLKSILTQQAAQHGNSSNQESATRQGYPVRVLRYEMCVMKGTQVMEHI